MSQSCFVAGLKVTESIGMDLFHTDKETYNSCQSVNSTAHSNPMPISFGYYLISHVYVHKYTSMCVGHLC